MPVAPLLTVSILTLVFGRPLFFRLSALAPHTSLWPQALLHFICALSLSPAPPPTVLTLGPLTSVSIFHLCSRLRPPPFPARIPHSDPGQDPELGGSNRLTRLCVLEGSEWGALSFQGSEGARGEGSFGLWPLLTRQLCRVPSLHTPSPTRGREGRRSEERWTVDRAELE